MNYLHSYTSLQLENDLRDLTGIPLQVKEKKMDGEFIWTVVPEFNDPESLSFSLIITVSDISTEVKLVLGDYSGNLLWNMSRVDIGRRMAFEQLSTKIITENGRLTFIINDNRSDPCDSRTWPIGVWNKITLTVKNFHEIDTEDEFVKAGVKWGCYILGMIFSLLDCDLVSTAQPCSVSELGAEYDGRAATVSINRYERSPVNRSLCLLKYGYKCQICGLDFEEKYGVTGKGIIEVHHITPVSKSGEVLINPETDLIPVCPNCHTMLHKKTPPYTPDEVREMINRRK